MHSFSADTHRCSVPGPEAYGYTVKTTYKEPGSRGAYILAGQDRGQQLNNQNMPADSGKWVDRREEGSRECSAFGLLCVCVQHGAEQASPTGHRAGFE